MKSSALPKVATLAVGTEVTDGQIIDKNSAWISAAMVEAGAMVIEHRAVPDDRDEIRRALRELGTRVDHLFVTGGLGPTSDDFTRDLIAEVFGRPLEFDSRSWQHLSELLKSRGLEVREIQRQQCYFPQGSTVLTNPAGTANAFRFKHQYPGGHSLDLYALPGPPTEIAAVWELNLKAAFDKLTPPEARERLLILRCLGRGESQIAEIVEDVIKGSPIRIGYRAHVPYVEVKIWSRVSDYARVAPVIAALETRLAPWIVSRDKEDATDGLLALARQGMIYVADAATAGGLAERITARVRELKLDVPLNLRLETDFSGSSPRLSHSEAYLLIQKDSAANKWVLKMKIGQSPESTLEVTPPYNYKVDSERGRRFITEKALLAFGALPRT